MRKAIIIVLAIAILGGLAKVTSKTTTGLSPSTTGTTSVAVTTNNSSATTSPAPAGAYKDGTYRASSDQNPYGTVEIAAVISSGKITDIKFLQMPDQEGHSREVTNYSEPILKQSALSKQSANIDFISGATDTSFAFEQSLQAALDQAKA